LYLSPAHLEALSGLEYFLLSKSTFCCLLGDPGLGKSTLAFAFLAALDRERYRTVFLSPASGAWRDAVIAIVTALGAPPQRGETTDALAARARTGTQRLYRSGGRLVLVVDEAQLMPLSTLEGLRLFVDALSFGADPVKLVLIGPADLDKELKTRAPALHQRIGIPLALSPLSRAQSIAYVNARIRQSGAFSSEAIFTPSALRALATSARGVPRAINALANLALVEGFAGMERPVSRKTVDRAVRGLFRRDQRRWPTPALLAASLILASVPALTLYLMLFTPAARHDVAAVQAQAPLPTIAAAVSAEDAPPPPAMPLRGPIGADSASVEGVASHAEGLKGDSINEGRHDLAVARP
jgi:type II secretory pathway predicted ATPase ExeA